MWGLILCLSCLPSAVSAAQEGAGTVWAVDTSEYRSSSSLRAHRLVQVTVLGASTQSALPQSWAFVPESAPCWGTDAYAGEAG